MYTLANKTFITLISKFSVRLKTCHDRDIGNEYDTFLKMFDTEEFSIVKVN